MNRRKNKQKKDKMQYRWKLMREKGEKKRRRKPTRDKKRKITKHLGRAIMIIITYNVS